MTDETNKQTVTAEDGVLIIDDPRIERMAYEFAAELGVSVEEAVFIALERYEARLLAEK